MFSTDSPFPDITLKTINNSLKQTCVILIIIILCVCSKQGNRMHLILYDLA